MRIPLSKAFMTHPEGYYKFTITKATYNEKFYTVELTYTSEKGSIVKKYTLFNADGSENSGACFAFSFVCRAALGDPDIESVEVDELLNKSFMATVTHTERESTKEPGKTVTFANIENPEACPAEAVPAFDMNAFLKG